MSSNAYLTYHRHETVWLVTVGIVVVVIVLALEVSNWEVTYLRLL